MQEITKNSFIISIPKINYFIIIFIAILSTIQGDVLGFEKISLLKNLLLLIATTLIVFSKSFSKKTIFFGSLYLPFLLLSILIDTQHPETIISYLKAIIFSAICVQTFERMQRVKVDVYNNIYRYLILLMIICISLQALDPMNQVFISFYREGIRMTPMRGDPNFWAIIIIVIFYFYANKRTKHYVFNILFLLALGSKTLLVVYFIPLINKLKKTRSLLFVICLLIGLTLVVLFMSNDYGLVRTVNEIYDGNYTFQRSYMWNRFGEIYLLSPIYGSGFHTSKDILNTYMHNDYLEYLVSYGLIGGVFLIIHKILILITIKNKKNIIIALLYIFLIPVFFTCNVNEFYIFSVTYLWTRV